jgi:hypothetical protein
MAEPMHARVPARRPANRRPRIPHPHLAPQPERPEREEEAVPASPETPTGTENSDWTRAEVPVVRPASRSRRGSSRRTPAERALRSALHLGLAVNVAVFLASRLFPRWFERWLEGTAFGGWSYGGDDFLLAAAVLLSGYALLAAGQLSRRDDGDR